MHALAISLAAKGYHVTGSDDEIYDPSLSRLRAAGLAPHTFGWDATRVDDADLVIVGMHARADNPELIAAQRRGIPIHSFPSYIAEVSKDKQQVVITGSHGKTTTTAMIMYALRAQGIDFDFLVGAEIEGFDTMVRLSDAPVIIIEGDEYLSSPIDRRPKFIHFDPDITVMTGIAWDHINVFPTEGDYDQLFVNYVSGLSSEAQLIYYSGDIKVVDTCKDYHNATPYSPLPRVGDDGVEVDGKVYPVSVIGEHNLQNMAAAYHVCHAMGMQTEDFFAAMATFAGADRRLQVLSEGKDVRVFYDFAHAPSKVKATTQAVSQWYPHRRLVACLELHTFSSLNLDFLPQYRGALAAADVALLYYSEHTLRIKQMAPLDRGAVQQAFGRDDLEVFTDIDELERRLADLEAPSSNLLLMSSGRFDGMDVQQLWA